MIENVIDSLAGYRVLYWHLFFINSKVLLHCLLVFTLLLLNSEAILIFYSLYVTFFSLPSLEACRSFKM